MKRKIISVLLMCVMTTAMLAGCVKPSADNGGSEAEQNEDSKKITIMSQDTTYGEAFEE